MENQEVLKALANLADKVGRYHERLLTIERDHSRHVQGCTCQKEVASGKDYPKGDVYDTLTICPACGCAEDKCICDDFCENCGA